MYKDHETMKFVGPNVGIGGQTKPKLSQENFPVAIWVRVGGTVVNIYICMYVSRLRGFFMEFSVFLKLMLFASKSNLPSFLFVSLLLHSLVLRY